ncbi:hypothetical protein D9619_013388 [Psilocybe cf. subviscida]|uniref:Uncharacterized protein n=1 Tax=Psilocybe cf. subviscida TaxID=2480587 RepID=A0A8H5BRH4_9AGAR|nr:hypothetical protein D9619_013388 [Psilocybe cf. subviscida]
MDSDFCDLQPSFGLYDPTRLIDDMQWLLTGIVASTIVYGFNVMVAILCLFTLLKARKEDDSKGRLGALSVYIIGMLGLATAAVVHSNLAVAKFARMMILGVPQTIGCATGLFSNLVLELGSPHLYNLVVPPSLPVTIWAADGILIWRCLVLYQAVSLPKKRITYFTLALLALFSLASGGYSFWNPEEFSSEMSPDTGLFEIKGGDIALKAARQLVLPSSIAINTVVAGLIAARLLYAQRLLAISFPAHDGNYDVKSPYITALEICVESSAAIVLWAAV